MIKQVQKTNAQRVEEYAIRYSDWFTQGDVMESLSMSKTAAFSALIRLKGLGVIEIRKSKGLRPFQYRFAKALQRSTFREKPKNIYEEIIRKGHDEDFQDRQPSQATGYFPGSREKIMVLRQRVDAGESLWHPDDARYYKHCSEHRPFEPQFGFVNATDF